MAQLSLKYVIVWCGLFFEGILCWFGYFLYQISKGINIDFDIRNHQTIIFCTLFVFFGRMILMFVDFDKKRIDAEIRKEELRKLKLENDILEDKKTPSDK